MNSFVFWGPNDEFIKEYDLQDSKSFSELVRYAQKEDNTFEIKGICQKNNNLEKIQKLSISSDEYSMVNEWVLFNLDLFLSRFDIENVYLQNPPNNVYKKISKLDNCEEKKYDYMKITSNHVKEINNNFLDRIIGQETVKKTLINFLYSVTFDFFNSKPLILMFYGPSGVGKTETAKFISENLGGELFRKQFSMFQNNEFANYLFGTKHNESSFAKDLLDRKTNVILLDEFDKANNLFFSAFYQLFDEGIFIDKNYSVELKNAIIICTSNYGSIKEIKDNLGSPIYNRFDGFIQFESLDKVSCIKLIEKYYDKYFDYLDNTQQTIVEKNNVKQLLLENATKFNNAREIERVVRNTIMLVLTDNEI